MTALGAISVLGDGPSLSTAELEAFRDIHVDLLGVGEGERRVGARSSAFRLGSRASSGRDESAGGSWALSVGAVRGRDRLWDAPLGSLDGQFAAVTHDAESSVTRIIADPLGMQRYYVAEQGGRLYASTSGLALARALGSQPDLIGVATFLATGGQFGRRTIWAGVERLEPGVVVEVANGRRSASVYWTPEVDGEAAQSTLAGSAQRNTEVLVGTLRAHFARSQSVLADLTGGFDSRLLTLSLCRAEVPIVSTTSGSEHQQDVVIAREIARRLGLAWRWIPPLEQIDSERSVQALDEAVAWTDGHINALEALPVLASHARNGSEFRGLINGGGGEHLRYYAWAQEFPKAGRTRRVNYARWINYRVLSPVDTGIFRADPLPTARQDVDERMRPVAARYEQHPNTVQLDAMYAYKSTGHFGAWMSLARRHLDVELPFYCKPVFETAFSTSYRYRNHNRLIRRMITGLNPDIARLPTERGGSAEPWRASNVHRFVPFYTRQIRNLIPRATHRVTGRALLAGQEPPADSGIMPALLAQGALDPKRMRSAPLYDSDRLSELLKRQADPNAPASALLGRVLTVERALVLADTGIADTDTTGA